MKGETCNDGHDCKESLTAEEYIEILEDALNHISRVARNSSTQSKRNRWIEARANIALDGKEFDMYELPNYPKMNITKLEKTIEKLEQVNNELKN